MKSVFLLLGSNLGNRESNLSRAVDSISQEAGEVLQQSFLYETAAWGKTDQPAFYNQAVEIETDLQPEKLLRTLKSIEQKTGRTSAEKWSARVIDIDIIFYGNEIYKSETLIIPHAFIQDRKFVLEPLNEIAADFLHPVLNLSVRELLARCADELKVTKL